jgi:hypothetical protein
VTAAEDVAASGVKKGHRVWASHKNAHLNVWDPSSSLSSQYSHLNVLTSSQPADFPNPEQINPKRPGELYIPTPTYFMGCPGPLFVEQVVAEFVRAVFLLKGVRRADGFAGKLVGFSTEANQTAENWYITPSGATDAFPQSMHLVVRFYISSWS